MIRFITAAGLALVWVAAGHAAELSALEIMTKLEKIALESHRTSYATAQLMSCKVALSAGKVQCVEQPRVKKMESVSMRTGDDLRDSKSFAVILAPANEKGIGMLTYQYNDPNKDTESWLYLSALGKVKRMVSRSGEDEEPVSIFGSEFTTEDMEQGQVENYTYEMIDIIKDADGQVKTWIIEATPTAEQRNKTRYSRSRQWIDAKRWVVTKVQAFDKANKLYKQIQFADFQPLNGNHNDNNDIWVANTVNLLNVRTSRLSQWKQSHPKFNIDIAPQLFTQQALTDFAMREAKLQPLRQ